MKAVAIAAVVIAVFAMEANADRWEELRRHREWSFATQPHGDARAKNEALAEEARRKKALQWEQATPAERLVLQQQETAEAAAAAEAIRQQAADAAARKIADAAAKDAAERAAFWKAIGNAAIFVVLLIAVVGVLHLSSCKKDGETAAYLLGRACRRLIDFIERFANRAGRAVGGTTPDLRRQQSPPDHVSMGATVAGGRRPRSSFSTANAPTNVPPNQTSTQAKSETPKLMLGGGCFGSMVGAGCLLPAGLLLCCTGIGAIIGIPLILWAIASPIAGSLLGVMPGAIKGPCPYCGNEVSLCTANKAMYHYCGRCFRTILVRGKTLHRTPEE